MENKKKDLEMFYKEVLCFSWRLGVLAVDVGFLEAGS
jgi:hypothetical protein